MRLFRWNRHTGTTVKLDYEARGEQRISISSRIPSAGILPQDYQDCQACADIATEMVVLMQSWVLSVAINWENCTFTPTKANFLQLFRGSRLYLIRSHCPVDQFVLHISYTWLGNKDNTNKRGWWWRGRRECLGWELSRESQTLCHSCCRLTSLSRGSSWSSGRGTFHCSANDCYICPHTHHSQLPGGSHTPLCWSVGVCLLWARFSRLVHQSPG